MHNLLDIDDFESGEIQSKTFSVWAEKLTIGEDVQFDVCLEVKYDRHFNPYIYFKDKADFSTIFEDRQCTISGEGLREPVDLIITSTQISMEALDADIEACLQTQPLALDFQRPFKKAEAVLINAPPLFFSNHEPVFYFKNTQITMREFSRAKEIRKKEKHYRYEKIATGSVTIESIDGTSVSGSDVIEAVSYFTRFLTFVRGAHCGAGNAIAKDAEGLAYALIGFTRGDQFDVQSGWYNIENAKKLPEVFEHYKSALSVEQDAPTLLRTIEFYRASNIARDSSLEMAIVAAHTALETITPHLLRSQAGWSESLLSSKGAFHDKLRAASRFIGLSVELDEHSPAIRNRKKHLSNIDAFEMISVFRNRIVHQGKKFEYTGVELVEIWAMSQWLVEIFIFHFMDFRGDVIDRRRYTGWHGPAVSIPLP